MELFSPDVVCNLQVWSWHCQPWHPAVPSQSFLSCGKGWVQCQIFAFKTSQLLKTYPFLSLMKNKKKKTLKETDEGCSVWESLTVRWVQNPLSTFLESISRQDGTFILIMTYPQIFSVFRFAWQDRDCSSSNSSLWALLEVSGEANSRCLNVLFLHNFYFLWADALLFLVKIQVYYEILIVWLCTLMCWIWIETLCIQFK